MIGGLIPYFVHRQRKEVLEVLGCYFHGCPRHFPDVRKERTATLPYRGSVYKKNGYMLPEERHFEVKERRKLAFRDAGVKDPSVYAR